MSVKTDIEIREKMANAFNELLQKVKKIQDEYTTKEEMLTWTFSWNSCMTALHLQLYGDVAENQIRNYIILIERMRLKKPGLIRDLTKKANVVQFIADEVVKLQSSEDDE